METIEKQKYIKLKEDTFFFPMEEGTYFRNNVGYFIIKGKKNYAVIRDICSLLNGALTFDAITKGLDEREVGIISKIINVLDKNGFIKYIDDNEIKNKSFINEVNFLEYYTNQGEELFEYFSNSNIKVIGDNDLAKKIKNSLNNLGATNVKSIINNSEDIRSEAKEDLIIFCNFDIDDFYHSLPEISTNNKYIYVDYIKGKGIISPFIKSKNDYLSFKKSISFEDNHLNNPSFTTNSILSSVISFEIFKSITKCLPSNLETSLYILDIVTIQGEFFRVKKNSTSLDTVEFIKKFEDNRQKYGSPIVDISRGDFTQLPFSRWDIKIKTNKGSLLVKDFGDSHEEARKNAYYKALEELHKYEIVSPTNLTNINTGESINSRSLLFKEHSKITLAVSENSEEAENSAVLRSVFNYISNKYNSNSYFFNQIDIKPYLCDKRISYYYQICLLIVKEVKISVCEINSNLVLVKCESDGLIGFNIGFDIKTAILNSLRTFILKKQLNSETSLDYNFNFQSINKWEKNSMVNFLEKENITMYLFDMKDKILKTQIFIKGVLLEGVGGNHG